MAAFASWLRRESLAALVLGLLPVAGGLGLEHLPTKVVDIEYAVRGEIDILAQELKERLSKADHGLPFDEIVPCNIGNPQALGQSPIQFHRQVLSLLTNPELQDKDLYLKDVHERAKLFSNATAFGAYSHSKGVPLLREYVARFISERDGTHHPQADPETIFLTDGASPAAKMSLQMLIDGALDGVLIPIPQYPLYTAAIANLGGTVVGYYLNEEQGWSVMLEEIESAAARFQQEHPTGRLKAIVVINPGNPTGNVMSRSQMEGVVRFCRDRNIVLLADEVYQENVWSDTKPWESFRKVALDLQMPIEIMSFHSISKGSSGECGLRGGYVHLHNIDPKVQEQVYKIASITLCANTLGQAMTASIMRPPRPGDPSFEQFSTERRHILESLRRKSALLTERLNRLPGVSCQASEGAMYAFPRIHLPAGAIRAAAAAGREPDAFYCVALLEATGIVVVPGSGFRQRPGTWHFRITILPQEAKLPALLDRLEAFHVAFMRKYSADEL